MKLMKSSAEYLSESVDRKNSSESGIALVMVLILSTIALATIAGLIYMLTTGTQLSGLQKRYKTSLEAGKGSVDFGIQVVHNIQEGGTGDPGSPLWSYSLPGQNVGGVNCLVEKLSKATLAWNAACDNSFTIDPTDATTYDFTTDLGSSLDLTFRTYGKIIDTVEGETGADFGLTKGGVTEAESMTGKHPHWLHTIELNTQRTNNPSEQARLSVLYEY